MLANLTALLFQIKMYENDIKFIKQTLNYFDIHMTKLFINSLGLTGIMTEGIPCLLPFAQGHTFNWV